jgi:hypothetical protein
MMRNETGGEESVLKDIGKRDEREKESRRNERRGKVLTCCTLERRASKCVWGGSAGPWRHRIRMNSTSDCNRSSPARIKWREKMEKKEVKSTNQRKYSTLFVGRNLMAQRQRIEELRLALTTHLHSSRYATVQFQADETYREKNALNGRFIITALNE